MDYFTHPTVNKLALRSLEDFGSLFYIVSPNRTTFEKVEDVPNYHLRVMPYIFALIILEQLILAFMKKPTIRLNDGVISASQAMFYESFTILFRTWRFVLYSYIYNNWRIVNLPWDSAWTWWICFIVIDFLYYWTHRASHEINILWAAHQVHHSSEDYNLTTGLRQSSVLNALLWIMYMPMAFAVPPSAYLVHSYLNLLYQFWIHTQTIKSLGPLEYILNTASHHRVHHGRNKYCIDKNYAGVLIIWDRMFGTFQAEDEEVVYGLTHPLNSFNLFYLQFNHFKCIWDKFREMKGWKNKLSAIFKGPGWSPGKPWHGNLEDIPKIEFPVKKYDPQLSWCASAYAVAHIVFLVSIIQQIGINWKVLPNGFFPSFFVYITCSLLSIGSFLDKRSYAPWLELFGCMMYFILDAYMWPYTIVAELPEIVQQIVMTVFRLFYLSSGIFWMTYCLRNVKITWYTGSKKID